MNYIILQDMSFFSWHLSSFSRNLSISFHTHIIFLPINWHILQHLIRACTVCQDPTRILSLGFNISLLTIIKGLSVFKASFTGLLSILSIHTFVTDSCPIWIRSVKESTVELQWLELWSLSHFGWLELSSRSPKGDFMQNIPWMAGTTLG